MSILFVQTGGTIDKDYPQIMASYGFEITEPAVKKFMKQLKPGFKYRIAELLKKDSLDISDADRKKIADVCAAAKEKKNCHYSWHRYHDQNRTSSGFNQKQNYCDNRCNAPSNS
jgi:L-asparaginase/Glu-tRNA(Gln) amidotransferase subunit D